MKKTRLLLLLLISATMVFTACEKDNKPKTEKERVTQLLVSGKWYYQTFKGVDNTKSCWEPSNYWEFKTNGSFDEHWDFGTGTYVVSADGKTINLTREGAWTISDILIDNNTFSFKLTGSGSTFEITLSKTVPAGRC